MGIMERNKFKVVFNWLIIKNRNWELIKLIELISTQLKQETKNKQVTKTVTSIG
jgi:hypothetical protein